MATAIKREAVSSDFKIAKCEPRSIVNLDYLQHPSPKQDSFFDATNAISFESRDRSPSLNEKLQLFHDSTQKAGINNYIYIYIYI